MGDSDTVVIDASTAHRVADGWTYGFPELAKDQRQKLLDSNRISNPGCYPTGAIALLRPLVDAGPRARRFDARGVRRVGLHRRRQGADRGP